MYVWNPILARTWQDQQPAVYLLEKVEEARTCPPTLSLVVKRLVHRYCYVRFGSKTIFQLNRNLMKLKDFTYLSRAYREEFLNYSLLSKFVPAFHNGIFPKGATIDFENVVSSARI